jgi:hypothetical protein
MKPRRPRIRRDAQEPVEQPSARRQLLAYRVLKDLECCLAVGLLKTTWKTCFRRMCLVMGRACGEPNKLRCANTRPGRYLLRPQSGRPKPRQPDLVAGSQMLVSPAACARASTSGRLWSIEDRGHWRLESPHRGLHRGGTQRRQGSWELPQPPHPHRRPTRRRSDRCRPSVEQH